MRDSASAALGASGLTAPVWMVWLDPLMQVLVSVAGLIVLGLTIRGKLIDNQIKRAALDAARKERKGG
ncbi:MAG: hypothetical protein Q4G25_15085 [Paracoccus sp. (in: a-proteobacteria)]|nr:hypothetical protein [Paracoccus sp. (in: a-proteobacteria)]